MGADGGFLKCRLVLALMRNVKRIINISQQALDRVHL